MGSKTLVRIACLVLATSVVALLAAAVGRADHHSITLSGPDSIGEAGGKATYTITASVDSPPTAEEGEHKVTVDYATEDGTATAGPDYTAKSGSVEITIPVDETSGSATVDVAVEPDGTNEANETFTFKAGGQSKTTTINDDDPLPKLTVAADPATVKEPTGGRFRVRLTGARSRNAKVKWSLGGSAKHGQDYGGPTSGELTFTPSQEEHVVNVPGAQDTLDEPDETLTLTLSEPENAELEAAGATVTIQDEDSDGPPSVAAADVNVTETDGDFQVTVPVTLSAPSGKEIKVNWATQAATADSDVDFVGASGTLTFEPGATTPAAPLRVTIKGDDVAEAAETFNVNLSQPVNVTIGDGQGKVTIADDDASSRPKLSVNDVSAGEREPGELTFVVSLSARPAQEISVTVSTGDDSATGGVDYQATTAVVRFRPADFGAGATKFERQFKVPIKDDTLDEPSERLFVRLNDPVGADIQDGEGVGTILDDDSTSAFGIDDATADELETGTSTATLKIKLSPASKRSVSVGWATADGTAIAGSDYEAASGTVILGPDQTEATISVTVKGDTVNEPNETFAIRLSGASGARIGDGEALVTIVDKNAPPSLSISDGFGRESEGVKFVVTLAGNTVQPVTVQFATSDGSARAPDDYSARRGSLTFQPGEKSKTLEVTVLDDTLSEPEESVVMTISDPVNAVITKARGIGLIEESDRVPATTTGTPRPPTNTNTPPTTRNVAFVTRVAIGPKTLVATRAGAVRFTVACNRGPTVGCKGTAILDEHLVVPKKTAKAAATKAKKPLRLGSKAFTVRVGRRGTVSVKLTKKGLALLRRKKVLKAKLTVVIREGTRTLRVNPGVVTLRVTKPKKASGPSVKVG